MNERDWLVEINRGVKPSWRARQGRAQDILVVLVCRVILEHNEDVLLHVEGHHTQEILRILVVAQIRKGVVVDEVVDSILLEIRLEILRVPFSQELHCHRVELPDGLRGAWTRMAVQDLVLILGQVALAEIDTVQVRVLYEKKQLALLDDISHAHGRVEVAFACEGAEEARLTLIPAKRGIDCRHRGEMLEWSFAARGPLKIGIDAGHCQD